MRSVLSALRSSRKSKEMKGTDKNGGQTNTNVPHGSLSTVNDDQTTLDNPIETQLVFRQRDDAISVLETVEPCDLCGKLDQSVLKSMVNRYYSGISLMEKKADANCGGCRMLCWIASDFQSRGNLKGPNWTYGLAVLEEKNNPIQFIVDAMDPDNRFADPGRNRAFQDKIYFEIFTDLGQQSPWTAIKPWRKLPRGSSMRLPAYLDNILVWVEKCAREHPECGHLGAVRLPKRVLDLGQPGTLTDLLLLEPGEFEGKYICLSHSWGTSQPIKTTRATIAEFSQRIPYEALPCTFQDAIFVTRHLGIRYLWIDSLCIVQDDRRDWEEQASKMADIYGKAYLTICATTSNGADTGLFPDLDVGLQEQRVPEHLVASSSPPIWYRRSLPHAQLQESMEHPSPYWWSGDENAASNENFPYPLLGRSWTFQEHLLSARVVQFARREIVWECSRCMWCCCRPDDCMEPMQGLKRSAAALLAPRVQFVKGPSPGVNELYQIWKIIVTRYNDKALTNMSDRLPALSGIAQRAKTAFQSKYLAGLWSNQLESQLCWSISTGGMMGATEGRYLTRYRAPSWSWASVEGPIQWNWVDNQTGDFRVLMAHCRVGGLDPTGLVHSGFLLVEGAVVECRFGGAKPPSPYLYRVETAEKSFVFNPDVPFLKQPYCEDVPLGTPLFCIAIGVVTDDHKHTCNFLVLKKARADRSVFQRIGWLDNKLHKSSWVEVFKGASKRQIMII